MRFSLRHLQIFATVARHESISAAADQLAMSQSAASTALIELERRYQQPLFDRAGKRVRLNETGRALWPHALSILDRAAEVDALLAGRTGPGPLKLGATQTIGNYLAPTLIQRYAERYPGCVLTLDIGNTDEIARAVADYSLDFGLLEGEYADPDLQLMNWIGDELVLICGPSHPLAARPVCSVDEILAERWVVREKGSGTRQTLDRSMRAYWSRWQIAIELQQIEAIVEMVAVSSMVGCVSRLAAREPLAQGRLVELRVAELDLSRRFYLLLHRQKYVSPGISAMMELCHAMRPARMSKAR